MTGKQSRAPDVSGQSERTSLLRHGALGADIPIAMNTVTIRPASFLKKLRTISEGGFAGVGLWMNEIDNYLKEPNARPVNELLQEFRLAPVEMHSFHDWQYLSSAERKQFNREAKDFFLKVNKMGIDCPVAAIATYDRVGKISEAVRDFKELCAIAEDFGIRVMFESVGWSKQFHDLNPSWEVVAGADCANGGLLFDTFHFVKTGSKLEDLEKISMEKVFLVHISDAKPLALDFKEQSRKFRFHPGEGEAPLKDIVKSLANGGYQGFYCVELFNEQYWADDPVTVVSDSKASLDKLFGSLSHP